MIVHDQFVIATPTKCGTYSWEALARAVPGMDVIRPLHLMQVPRSQINGEVFLCVRDPYDRLASVFTFIFHSPNRSQWGHLELDDPTFVEFLRWFKDQKQRADSLEWKQGRSPWVYTKSLTQCARSLAESVGVMGHLGVVQPIYLEDADEEMKWLQEEFRLVVPERRRKEGMYKQNTNLKWRPKIKWTKTERSLADDIWGEDAVTFGYDARS